MEHKFIVKIPKNTLVLQNCDTNLIIFKNKNKTITLKSKIKIIFNQKKKIIKITKIPVCGIPNNEKKKLNSSRGLLTAIIKQTLLELTEFFYQKLKFKGVGYRALPYKKFQDNVNIFSLKLGLSHPLYLNPSNKFFSMFCLKFTKLFIFGNSYCKIAQTAAYVRSYKIPEPYKGKGILYVNENIKLKEGKKI